MKGLSKLILWLAGWKLEENVPKHIKKCVLVHAQHTSNWDFVYGKLAGYVFEVKPRVLIKNTLFFFPLGVFLKSLGGLPVNRGKNNDLVKDLTKEFNSRDELMVLFTPEGTRSYSSKWKKGFYYLAKEANVPVIPVYIDFATKKIGFSTNFELSDNVDHDIEKLKTYFKQFKGKIPENGIK